jgi:hypothetical protein
MTADAVALEAREAAQAETEHDTATRPGAFREGCPLGRTPAHRRRLTQLPSSGFPSMISLLRSVLRMHDGAISW